MPAGLPPDKRMVDFHRLQGCLFPHTNAHIVPEVSTFSCSGSILPYQSHNPHRIHGSGEGGKTDGSTQGYKKKQYLDNWLVSQISPNLSPAYPDSGSFVPGAKLESEYREIQAEPKHVFDFVGYQFILKEGKIRPTGQCWLALNSKIQKLLPKPTCPFRQLMSLIELLTATEKQVHLGRLLMTLI